MNKPKQFFLRTILFFILTVSTFAQQNAWVNTQGPFKGYPLSLAAGKNGLVFALTWSGIYKSTDHGLNWNAVNNSIWIRHYNPITPWYGTVKLSGDGTLFLITGDSLLYKSTDNGNTWTSLENALNNIKLWDIYLGHNNKIFGITNKKDIYFSSDDGNSWKKFDYHLNLDNVISIAEGSDGRMIMCTDTNIYFTSDNGINWKIISNKFSSVDFLPNEYVFGKDGAIFACISNKEIAIFDSLPVLYRSTDNGDTWDTVYNMVNEIHIGIAIPMLGPDGITVDSAGDLFFLNRSLILRSKDNGKSWQKIHWADYIPEIYPLQMQFYTDPDNNFYLVPTTREGLRYLKYNDTVLVRQNRSFSTIGLTDIAVNPVTGSVFAATDSGVYRENKDSTEWRKSFMKPSINVWVNNDYNGNIYAVFDSDIPWQSTDNGDSWNSIGNYGKIFGSKNNNIFRWYSDHLFVSTDYGSSWNQIDTGHVALKYGPPVTMEFAGSLAVIAMPEEIYFSENYGKTWNLGKSIGISNQSGILFSPADINTVAIDSKGNIYAGTDLGLYRSKDTCKTWVDIDNNLPKSIQEINQMGNILVTYQNIKSMVITAADRIFIGYDRGVYYSTDQGKTWIDFNRGLSSLTKIKSLSLDNEGNLYAGTTAGLVYKANVSSINSVIKTQKIEPENFNLKQNYPNPFNPTTVINYYLPVSGFVTLKVYNVLGMQIKTLVDKYQSQGNYNIIFNGSELASGVYFYTLRTKNNFSVRKMVLLK